MKRKVKPKIIQKGNSNFTPDQLRQIFFAQCMDRDHLYEWIKLFWGVNLPGAVVSRYSSCNPLDSVWDVYNHCLHLKQGMDTLYIAPRGGGKCVAAGTLIPVQGQGLKKIEDVQKDELVYSGFEWRKVLQTFDEGPKLGYGVCTKNGLSVVGSVNHRVMIASVTQGVEWKHLSDITESDFVYCAGDASIAMNTNEFNDGWLVGAIVGDGSIVDTPKNKRVDFCAGDDKVATFYKQLMLEKFGKTPREWQNSKNSKGYQVNSTALISWLHQYIDGRLAYDKRLKTLNHSDAFLAGFLVGLFDTDGSKDEMTLANERLVVQVAKLLTKFGVFNRVIYNRKKPRFSQFIQEMVSYHSVHFISKLPDFLLPIGEKRAAFKKESDKRREQYRYPATTVEFFIKALREEYELSNGWMLINGRKARVIVPYADNISKRAKYIEGHKILAWSTWAAQLGLTELSDRLSVVYDGYFQKVSKTWQEKAHFYDLSVDVDHSYVSNGVVSHNTLGVAITESALMFHDKRGVVHVGAIEKQSKRAYQYFQNFIAKNKDVLGPLVEKDTIEKTVLVVDNEQVSLECLPCTMAALNGPHEACIVMDELDTLSPEGRLAYKQINGIPVKHRLNGAPPVKIGISTRKSAYGLVQQQIDTAEEQGRTVKMWNQIDLMEKCQPSRHGTKEITIYVDQEKMKHLPQEEFDKLADSKKPDYVSYQGTDGCLKCPLFSVCLGDAKKQDPKMTAASSTMIATIDDVLKKVRSADADWVMAELMCMKPSVEGIVFKEFDKTRHVVSWAFMWKVLTKEDPTVDIDEVTFVRELHKRQVPVYAGIDWGWAAPSTLTVAAVDQDDNVYVLKSFGITKTNDPTFIHMIKTKFHKFYRVQMYYPDNANGSGVDLMKSAGLPVAAKIDKSENLGVQVIKRCLNIPGTSETKLMIAKGNCDQLIHEMERYHYETDSAGNPMDGRFAKEFDHAIDGLRYMLVAVMGKARFVISQDQGSGDSNDPLFAADGAYLRAPNFYELARLHHVAVNVPESKPFNRPDDDDDAGPDGFSWGF